MPAPVPVPDADAFLVDTQGFEMDQYVGAYVLPGEEPAIVETGASPTADNVLRALDDLSIDRAAVRHVLVTHVHLDHAGAAWRLLQELPNAKLVVHEKGERFLTDAEMVGKLMVSVERAVGPRFPLYGTIEPIDRERVVTVRGGESLEVAGRTLDVHDTPGHAPHHVVFNDAERRVFWAGDTLGIRTPGGPLLMTTPPPRFDAAGWDSTFEVLDGLDARWALLTHFGWVRAKDQIAAYRDGLHAWTEEIERLHARGVSEADAIGTLSKAHPEGRAIYDEGTYEAEMEMNTRGVWLALERARAKADPQ